MPQSQAPIAVIGIGCRFPGASSVPALWQLLRSGGCGLGPFPRERFGPSELAQAEGGFLTDVDCFDADFFHISPRQAEAMDPQHRLLLEVAYEACEDAGLTLDRLAGSQTGVYVGQWNSDYERMQWAGRAEPDLYVLTGASPAMASGQISSAFDLRGPSLTLDSHCSSSLLAVHLASQSLQQGECDLALAAGVNLILSGDHSSAYARSNMLSPDCRCKFADAGANGFVRGEAVAVVILKRLAEAERDGDRIWAVLSGSAASNDGDSSQRFSPSQEGQVATLGKAYRAAGLSPQQVQYVEAHGTGTPVGDPIELASLAQVVGSQREPDSACRVGSIKSNLGHCEAAAGLAGFIKVCLCLHHRMLVPSLLDRPREDFDWQASGLRLARALEPWPVDSSGVARAGVSSFGLSGTNVHVVLQSAPAPRVAPAQANTPLLVLSARSPEALERLARLAGQRLETEEIDPFEFCASAAGQRSHLPRRLAVTGETREQLAAQLREWKFAPGRSVARVLFVFPGQGSQWVGMGQALYQQEPVFARAWEECAAHLKPYLNNWQLQDVWNREQPDWLDRVEVVQPAIFALQVSLARLFESWGLAPDGVCGHSMGEVAAAVVSGCLPLDQAARVIALRSRLLTEKAPPGAMALVELSRQQTLEQLTAFPELSLAASNGPRFCVVAGPRSQLDQLLQQLQAENRFARLIRADVASHSAAMDPLLDPLRQLLGDLDCSGPVRSFYSTVECKLYEQRLDAEYWVRNLRQPVLFQETIQVALADGYTHYLEISPHPVLLPVLQEIVGESGLALAALHREKAERIQALQALGRFYVDGLQVRWENLFAGRGRSELLPSYPWEKQRFWLARSERASAPRLPVKQATPPPPAGQPVAERQLEQIVREALASVLSCAPQAIDQDRPFRELGLDSIGSLGLRNRLEQDLRISLSATAAWNYPTVKELSQHLSQLLEGVPTTPVDTALTSPRGEHRPEPIYVLGIGVRLPGSIRNPEGLWKSLMKAEVHLGPAPAGRSAGLRAGGYLENIDRFDREFFSISRAEAASLDPAQRILLECSWNALEDAGVIASDLAGSRTGVFIGALGFGEYHSSRMAGSPGADPYSISGGCHSFLAQRLSFQYDLKGPCLTLDTACTSGLTALHCAMQSLRQGECDRALVGGVNLLLGPDQESHLAQLGLLSDQGEYRPFDASASGSLRGEACVVLLVGKAPEGGAPPWGLLLGSAMAQSGRGNGITAPNGLAQREVILTALREARLEADQVSYVEAHGSGSRLGDALELEALGSIYGQSSCWVSSLRANLGHSEAPSGLVSLVKSLLCLRHQQIPPQPGFSRINPEVRCDHKLLIPGQAQNWAGSDRRAAVHCLAAGGSQIHLLVSSPPEPDPSSRSAPRYLLCLSAADEAALAQLLEQYQELLPRLSDERLADLCASAALGRAALAWRQVFWAETATQLREQVAGSQSLIKFRAPSSAQFRLETEHPGREWQGLLAATPVEIVPAASTTLYAQAEQLQIQPDCELSRLKAIGWLWCQGVDIDWKQVFSPGAWCAPPLYPFQGESIPSAFCLASSPASIPATVESRTDWPALVGEALQQHLDRPIDPNERRTFADLGLTSLAQFSLLARLQKFTSRKLPQSTLYEYPTVSSLTGYLESLSQPTPAAPPAHSSRGYSVLALLFLMLLWTPALGGYFHLQPDTPVLTNSVRPEAAPEEASWAEWTRAIESKLEFELPFRVWLTRQNARLVTGLLHSSLNPEVLPGRNGFLFSQISLRFAALGTYPPTLGATLEANARTLESFGIHYLVVRTAWKEEVYPQFLPPGLHPHFPGPEQRAAWGRGGAYDFLDLMPDLLGHRLGHSLFERTGVHWNQFGAFFGYRQIASQLNQWYPDIQPLDESEVELHFQTEWGSDEAQKLAVEDQLLEQNIKVTPLFPNDHRADSRILQNHRLSWGPTATEISSSALPTAVVFQNSNAIRMHSLLSQHFRRVVYVQNGRPAFLAQQILAQERPDVVIHFDPWTNDPECQPLLPAAALGRPKPVRPENKNCLCGEAPQSEVIFKVKCARPALVSLPAGGLQLRRRLPAGVSHVHFNSSGLSPASQLRWLEGEGEILSRRDHQLPHSCDLGRLFEMSSDLVGRTSWQAPRELPVGMSRCDLASSSFSSQPDPRGLLSHTLEVQLPAGPPGPLWVCKVVTENNSFSELYLYYPWAGHPVVQSEMVHGLTTHYFRLETKGQAQPANLTLTFTAPAVNARIRVHSLEIRAVPPERDQVYLMPPGKGEAPL